MLIIVFIFCAKFRYNEICHVTSALVPHCSNFEMIGLAVRYMLPYTLHTF